MPSWHDSVLAFSAVAAVAELLLRPAGAWVWSRDGARLLWANPAGGELIGVATFADLWARRWPPGHPLRREIRALLLGMPDAGTVARLRLSNSASALPLACRCSRVRAGEERGILVAALDPLPGFPARLRLPAFFSDDEVTAELIGDADGPLPGSTEVRAGEPSIRLADGGWTGRLALRVRQAAEPAKISEAEQAGLAEDEPASTSGEQAALAAVIPIRPGQENGERAATVAVPAHAEANGEPAVPGEIAAWSAPASVAASEAERDEAPPSRAISSTSRSEARKSRVAAEPAEAEPPPPGIGTKHPYREAETLPADNPEPEGLAPTPDGAAARSVMAGRVPRELSRRPVRFLWQTDAADRFLFASPGLEQVVGRNAEIIGERWQDAASRLGLDPSQRISRALAERDTWSGQTAWWPIEGSNVRVPAELTGLPIYGGDHSFQGYRGFGVLRPAEALMPAAYEARFGAGDQGTPPLAEHLPPYEESPTTAPALSTAANVVPIRADLDRGDHVRLTAQERSAFEEIAAALRERVEASELAHVPVDSLPQASEPPPSAREEPAVPSEAAEPLPEPPLAVEHASPPEELAPDVAGLTADPAESETADDLAATEEAPRSAVSGQAHEPAEAETPDDARPQAAATDGHVSARPARAVPEVWIAPPPPVGGAEPARPSAPAASRPLAPPTVPPNPPAGRAAEGPGDAEQRLRELTAILDTATDGVVILDANGTIESVNASAEALFGLDAKDMQGLDFGGLLTPATRGAAEDYLSGLRENGVASLLNEGREVHARAGAGSIPLFMTMGRISNGDAGRFCAVLRDITHWKRTEAELVAAKRAAEAASSQKSEFLARVSHEIRTPLNAIIGFAEVMIEERFGPVENERYREYLRDIRTSGEHVVSLVNDLLDISKIEAGKLDLHFAAVPLNDVVRECIAIMQPQASRGHVVLRSSLSRDVPGIVADGRTLRQIVLNLLSNSVKFTGPGGQVIASTSLAETGEAVLRIRDTGEGMSEEELARALEPFRQIATTTLADRTGTGLGLPLTKALVEANRAALAIRSARGEGTVVTVTFPPTRVLSE